MGFYKRTSKIGLTGAMCLLVVGGANVSLTPSAAAAFVTTATASSIATRASVSPAAVSTPSFDTQLLVLINRFRIANGRQPLTLLADLSDRATAWSSHLRAVGALSHDRNLGSQAAAVCSVRAIRENVAYADAVTPSRLLTNYLNSPPHRANLVATDVRFIGLGTVTSASRTASGSARYWNTMKFVGGRCPSSSDTRTSYHSSTIAVKGSATSVKGRLIPLTIDVHTRTSHPSWVAVYFTSSTTHVTSLITTALARPTSVQGLAVLRFSTHATSTGVYTAVYGGGRLTSSQADLGSTGRHVVSVTR